MSGPGEDLLDAAAYTLYVEESIPSGMPGKKMTGCDNCCEDRLKMSPLSLSFNPSVPAAQNWRIPGFENRLRLTERSYNLVDHN